MTLNRAVLIGLTACALACIPYACIRFVEWQIGVASRGRWD